MLPDANLTEFQTSVSAFPAFRISVAVLFLSCLAVYHLPSLLSTTPDLQKSICRVYSLRNGFVFVRNEIKTEAFDAQGFPPRRSEFVIKRFPFVSEAIRHDCEETPRNRSEFSRCFQRDEIEQKPIEDERDLCVSEGVGSCHQRSQAISVFLC